MPLRARAFSFILLSIEGFKLRVWRFRTFPGQEIPRQNNGAIASRTEDSNGRGLALFVVELTGSRVRPRRRSTIFTFRGRYTRRGGGERGDQSVPLSYY